MTVCRGIRGAVCVEENTPESILAATGRLLEQIVTANDLAVEDLASVQFTTTPDLNAAFPARAARQMGWVTVPLLCMQEIPVPGSLPRCIRVLALWNTDRAPAQVRHVYLGRARSLRPDLAQRLEQEGQRGTQDPQEAKT